MINLGRNPKFKNYVWGKNKGYGTKEHQAAIKAFGITRHHRKDFVQTFLAKPPKGVKSFFSSQFP